MQYTRAIEGYEGLYVIDLFGHLYDLKNKEYVTPKNWKDYKIFSLEKEGKTSRFFCHILVARAFIPNPDNLPEVNHIDRRRSNNYYLNLEWCTHRWNLQHSSGQFKSHAFLANWVDYCGGHAYYDNTFDHFRMSRCVLTVKAYKFLHPGIRS